MSSDTKDMEKVQDKVEISTLSSHDTFEKEGPLPRDPPDGGRGWLVVFGCFCGLMATQGYGYVSLFSITCSLIDILSQILVGGLPRLL
jgi:hypothetical protein